MTPGIRWEAAPSPGGRDDTRDGLRVVLVVELESGMVVAWSFPVSTPLTTASTFSEALFASWTFTVESLESRGLAKEF